ncbi:MAG: hypothetical protein AAGJ18_24125 [Bacteroidota bacterium]
MTFYENQLFHIYNQGNNQRPLFYSDENYEFFLWKMRAYLLPFGDLVSYCLMPNHYHWQFYVKKVVITRKELRTHSDEIEWQRRLRKYGKKAIAVKNDDHRTANENTIVTLNEAIGTLEHSYTIALNNQKNWSGSLFRKRAKAKDGWIDEFITVTKNGKDDFRFLLGNNYGFLCLNYIHLNPVKAKLVKVAADYQWSSARDYAGLRNGTLCNLEMGRQLLEYM